MIRRILDMFGGFVLCMIAGFALLFATANTEIMTEISAALGNNAAVKQLLHIGDDGGIASTRVAVYDADGTASYFYLGTNSVSVNDGTDNLMLIDGASKLITFAVGAAAGDDFTIEDTAGTDIMLIEGDTKLFTLTSDGGFDLAIGTDAGDDFIVNDGTDDLIHVQGDDNSVTINLATSSGNDFAINDGTNDLLLVEADQSTVEFNADVEIVDGTIDLIVSSHDGTNGLKLGAVMLTASATELNEVADMSTHVVAPATGNLAMTAALHGNRVLYYDDADGTITLPAATGTGYVYKVVLKTAATAAVIQAASASDSFLGGISGVDGDADTAIAYSADSADDTISLNGTSTGGIVGDWYQFTDVASGLFLVEGYAHHSGGSEATCFSAAVS